MNINMFKLENIASKRQRAHYESQGASPVRAPFFDESKELSPTKYSSLIPMKGIINTKRLSPLRVYYKNMDVLKSQKQAKSAHKLSALPPVLLFLHLKWFISLYLKFLLKPLYVSSNEL